MGNNKFPCTSAYRQRQNKEKTKLSIEGKQRETCKCVLNNGHEQQGMKLPKYNNKFITSIFLFHFVAFSSAEA